MRRATILVLALLLGLTACGGGDDSAESGRASNGDGAGGSGGDGDVVEQQPAGQAHVSVDGMEYTLEESPALGCDIGDDAITFSFWVGDNSIVLGGGANNSDEGWFGHIELTVFEPEGEEGPVSYFPDLAENGDRIAIAGDSMSYAGPMLKQPPNDGSNPPPVDAGNGTFSATCG